MAADVAFVLPPAAPGAVVLVVEDEPSVRRVILDALAKQGYDVIEAIDGR